MQFNSWFSFSFLLGRSLRERENGFSRFLLYTVFVSFFFFFFFLLLLLVPLFFFGFVRVGKGPLWCSGVVCGF